MADAIALPQARPAQPALQLLRVLPGVLLLAAVGYAGKLLERNVGTYAKAHHWTFPNIEYVLWAILIGLAIANMALRLTRREFHIFLHSPAQIVSASELRGLKLTVNRPGLLWQVSALERTAP